MKLPNRLLGALLVAYPLLAHALLPYAPTDAEVAQLPKFCAFKLGRPGPNSESQFGRSNWVHMHHYCHGLKSALRARTHPKDRVGYLRQAKGEYEYVFGHTEPGFWFRPQMYVEVARIHLQLKERPQAQSRLSEAIRLNPRYEAAYLALLDLLGEDGARSAALEVATQGLRYLPASEALKKVYLDNGGSRPFPEPIQTGSTTTPAPEPAATPEATSDSPPASVDQAATAGAAQEGEAAARVDGAAGSACRFCPPTEIQERWRESFQGSK